jgi:ferredoxin
MILAIPPRGERVLAGAATSSAEPPRRRRGRGGAGVKATATSGGHKQQQQRSLLQRRRVIPRVSAQDQGQGAENLENILNTIRGAEALDQDPDFYTLLGIEVGSAPDVIKQAYRERARVCHPDVAGEDGHEACVYLNDAYATLMDDDLRASYNFSRGQFEADYEALRDVMVSSEFVEALSKVPYTGDPLSKSVEPGHFACKITREDQLNKSVFVDEISCIGCRNCANIAPGVFRMESNHGRARVAVQWVNDEEDIQDAIDSCPTDCIHWVPKEQLAPLEYTIQHVCKERLNVGLMRAGQGQHRLVDIFRKTADFMKAINPNVDD